MKVIIRFFNDSHHEIISVECTPTGGQDLADARQEHIDRLWGEEDRETRFDAVEWL